MHYSTRNKIKDSFYWFIRSLMLDITIEESSYPVDLEFIFYFKGRSFDSSNCAFMGKMIEDCLVKIGVLKDDTTKYVSKVSYQSVKLKKAPSNRLEVNFYPNKT